MTSRRDGGRGPLDGIRVTDFSRVLAGPYATMLMADLGADVIKIESPEGDDTRHWVPPVDDSGRGTYFASANRNKRSIALNLKDPADWERAQQLVGTADVVVENFRPGVMERLGLDHASVAQSNPTLITCSITGFGDGPGASIPGYDLLVQAMGGLMSITGTPDGEPTKVGVALVDVITGLHALAGIQAALSERGRSGEGQHVKVSLLTSALSALVNQASSTLATDVSPVRTGNAHPSIAPYEVFATGGGNLTLAVGTDRQFKSLVTVLGHPELGNDERFLTNEARVAHRSELRNELVPLLSTRTAQEWTAVLREADVPAGPVNDVGQAFELAQSLDLGPVVELSDGLRSVRQVAHPVGFSRTPARYCRLPPDLDEHCGAFWLDR